MAEHIEEQQSKIEDGELSVADEVQARENIKRDYEVLSGRLQKASDKTRANVLKNPQFAAAFESDGTLKADFAAQLDTDIKNAGDTSGGLDRRYYSATARGREAEIVEGLAAQGTRVYAGELTKEEGAAYQKAKEVHKKLKSMGFVNTDLVLSETMPDANAYLDGRTVVIGKDSLADGSYVKHLVHETTHFTEGTMEWLDVMDHVFGKDGSAVQHLIERVKTSGYGVTDADVTAVLDAVREGKLKDTKLTETQQTLVTEVVAMQMEETFDSEDAINRLVGEKPNLAKRILERIKAFLQTFGKATDQDPEAVKRLRRTEELFRKALENAGLDYAVQESLTRVNEKNAQVSEVKRSKSDIGNGQKITVNMSDADRAAILRKQSIEPKEISVADGFDIDFEQLEQNRKSIVEKPLIEKMRKLGFLRSYKTDAVDVEFEFTGGGLRKSMNSQVSDYGGNLADLAKVVMNMQRLLDSAVLLEIHTDKAKGSSLENPQLMQTYVLLSAFKEKSTVTPVQFEIKQYVDDNNRLYLAVALTKIETGVMGDTILENQASTRLLPVSTISIPDLIQKINPQDENFFKYVPDAFLSEKQIEAKKRALAREAKKYGRVQYSRKSGNGVIPYSQIIPAEEHEYRDLTDVTDATGNQEATRYLPGGTKIHEHKASPSTRFAHRDVNELLENIRREFLTFTLEDGTEINGKISRRDGWDLDKWLYDTLNTANLKDKRVLAARIADQILATVVTESDQPLRDALGEDATALVREDLALSVAASPWSCRRRKEKEAET